jgi:hypothetical protein
LFHESMDEYKSIIMISSLLAFEFDLFILPVHCIKLYET